MTPDALLQQYPRETVRWLRRRLGMSQHELARHLASVTEAVAAWETRGAAIAPLHRARLAALLAPHLATSEGVAFAQSLAEREGLPR